MRVGRLNSTSFSWAPQVEHFGRDPRYSILVFDNRGVGNSGTPRGPYTCVTLSHLSISITQMCVTPRRTSGMAEDVIVLLDYLGWTEERSVHLLGLSLGGMIAQGALSRRLVLAGILQSAGSFALL